MLYHKIEGPFKRQQDNVKEVDRTAWRNPTVEMLAGYPIWVASEKIDGTNIRIIWDGHRVSFGGRTERAELPGALRLHLEETFLAPGVEELFEEIFGVNDAVIFGEGYGPTIQNGGKYRDTPGFIAFDISDGETMLSRSDARDICDRLSVQFVPEMSLLTLNEIIEAVTEGANSGFGDFLAEGYVAVPEVPLYDQRGDRIIVKIKAADLYRP